MTDRSPAQVLAIVKARMAYIKAADDDQAEKLLAACEWSPGMAARQRAERLLR